MSRRYTCNSEDYPEHLNPFREERDSDDFIKNKFNTVGRRKLKAVLNLTSWTGTLFPTKKTKPADREVTVLQKSSRTKFLTMTPKISRDLLERLSQRTNRNSRSSSPASNPAPSRDQVYSFSDFKITPKSSREKFARNPSRDERDEVETASYLWASPGRDATSPCSPTTPISEGICVDYYDLSEETKHTKQGAKPKKKRQAPLPPPPTVFEMTAGPKQDNTTAEIELEEPLVLSVPASPEPQRDGQPLLSLPEPSPESSMNIQLSEENVAFPREQH